MKQYDVVIIGGGPGGVMTALSARNTYPDKSILLIRREKIALIPCGIPYMLHTLPRAEDNILPDAALEKNNIEILVNEVVSVDPESKRIELKSGESLEFTKLVLAVGTTPFIPPIEGIDLEGVYFIKKNIDYMRDLKERINAAKNIVIVGGGFIGVECADELLKAGKNVTIVEMLKSLLPLSIDKEFGDMVADVLKEKGAEVLTNVSVKAITGNGKVESVTLNNGEKRPADLVIVAVGYRPNVKLAQKMGLEVDPRYGIIVDEYMRTSANDIFAVGDCTAKRHFLTADYTKLMLASTAMAQGRLVGSSLFGIKVIKEFLGFLGTFSTKVCDVAFASVGLTEDMAKAAGIDYVVGTHEVPDRHPGKLPGASKIYMKLIFARYSHQLLGAQIRGGDSVGELINLLSVMVQNRMTDLEIDALQIGTHPLLTASPLSYPVIAATVNAIIKWYYKVRQI
ncbi:MAG: pyridine nucleotide-disulfide oxidoreductase [Candidatus Thorarchaeota archaeon]|nr:MAG: pyridine nucleotide-disulfide oxidoreductase [Candidatus Thorarchaeota archaeon]